MYQVVEGKVDMLANQNNLISHYRIWWFARGNNWRYRTGWLWKPWLCCWYPTDIIGNIDGWLKGKVDGIKIGFIEGVEDGLIDILGRDNGRLHCIIDFMGLFVGKNVGSIEGGINGCSNINWILDDHRLSVHLVCY